MEVDDEEEMRLEIEALKRRSRHPCPSPHNTARRVHLFPATDFHLILFAIFLLFLRSSNGHPLYALILEHFPAI